MPLDSSTRASLDDGNDVDEATQEEQKIVAVNAVDEAMIKEAEKQFDHKIVAVPYISTSDGGRNLVDRILVEHGPDAMQRGRQEIIAGIIELTSGGIIRTSLMYRANLSFTQARFYQQLLIDNGMIELIEQVGERPTLRATEKGRRFYSLQCHIMDMIGHVPKQKKKSHGKLDHKKKESAMSTLKAVQDAT